MPSNIEIQKKVLEITANESVNEQTKLAVRKQFYVLKNEEIDFEMKTLDFSNALDKVLSSIKVEEVLPTVPKQVPKVNSFEDIQTEPEEIIIPQINKGVKVRMQESLDPIVGEEESTDFEVPFEADEQ